MKTEFLSRPNNKAYDEGYDYIFGKKKKKKKVALEQPKWEDQWEIASNEPLSDYPHPFK